MSIAVRSLAIVAENEKFVVRPKRPAKSTAEFFDSSAGGNRRSRIGDCAEKTTSYDVTQQSSGNDFCPSGAIRNYAKVRRNHLKNINNSADTYRGLSVGMNRV
jgi:hypothetical protein